MAGTIPGLALTQQLDKDTGKLLSGGRVYFYQAATSTPQSAYSDSALTTVLPNPIILAQDGRVPNFYLADGSIRVRLTNKAGVVQFDYSSMLVIGASGGTTPGTTIDTTAIFATGDVMWSHNSGARSGWVRNNGRTIGSATSGATERANADVQTLFSLLWNNFVDAVCPVVSGRGASAAADWSANRQITVPDWRGFSLIGADDMGSSAASRFTGVPFAQGNQTTPGSKAGEVSHTLSTAELPAITPTITITDPGHTHRFTYNHSLSAASGAVIDPVLGIATSADSNNIDTQSKTTGITAASSSFGSGSAHNVTQNSVVGTWYMKV